MLREWKAKGLSEYLSQRRVCSILSIGKIVLSPNFKFSYMSFILSSNLCMFGTITKFLSVV